MRYFLDTEFIERGPKFPVTLISVALVAEDGRSLYRVSSDFDPADAGSWVEANVLPKIAGMTRLPVEVIAIEVRKFVGEEKPEFWGYYSAYDWVVFCQMFGTMMHLPKGWPMYCNDIKQLAKSLGNPKLLEQGKGEHDAFQDACWNKLAYNFLMGLRPSVEV